MRLSSVTVSSDEEHSFIYSIKSHLFLFVFPRFVFLFRGLFLFLFCTSKSNTQKLVSISSKFHKPFPLCFRLKVFELTARGGDQISQGASFEMKYSWIEFTADKDLHNNLSSRSEKENSVDLQRYTYVHNVRVCTQCTCMYVWNSLVYQFPLQCFFFYPCFTSFEDFFPTHIGMSPTVGEIP